jgi:two-component system, NtrC family, sensor histidine kinase PilS
MAELSRHLLWLIALRALILFLIVNLAEPLDLLPARFGPYSFLPFFNIVTVTLTFLCLALWWNDKAPGWQLYFQAGADLILATVLVAVSGGINSVFVSVYLLIIIYCSLLLGQQGGMVGAAVSAILFSGIAAADKLGILTPGSAPLGVRFLTFRIALNAAGFFAIAFLGTYLHRRLRTVQEQLQEKITSLEHLQALHEHIVSSIRSGLITTDLQGTITVFNSTAAELTERQDADVLGQPVWSIAGRGLWSKILGADLLHDARALRHEEWSLLPGGTQRFLGFSVSPLVDQEQHLLGYIISFQDLTEIKRLEEEIRVRDRMAAIGRMAAGIAHEIRNPLTAMRGSVEILRSRLSLPKSDERLFDIMIRESDRLNKFVEDFLQFARPVPKTHEQVDLVPLLRDSITLLQNSPEVREKHRVLLSVESPEIPVVGNADQLRQVFWNLAQNGLRAMPEGGVLNIAARKEKDGGGQLIFRDSGIGMTPEEKSQLFQPFQSGFKGGAGLGLSIVFQIMEDHHGRISVESDRGRGTTVILYLPRDARTQPPILTR